MWIKKHSNYQFLLLAIFFSCSLVYFVAISDYYGLIRLHLPYIWVLLIKHNRILIWQSVVKLLDPWLVVELVGKDMTLWHLQLLMHLHLSINSMRYQSLLANTVLLHLLLLIAKRKHAVQGTVMHLSADVAIEATTIHKRHLLRLIINQLPKVIRIQLSNPIVKRRLLLLLALVVHMKLLLEVGLRKELLLVWSLRLWVWKTNDFHWWQVLHRTANTVVLDAFEIVEVHLSIDLLGRSHMRWWLSLLQCLIKYGLIQERTFLLRHMIL